MMIWVENEDDDDDSDADDDDDDEQDDDYYATGFPFALPTEDGDRTTEENWLHWGMVSKRCSCSLV